MQRFRNRQHSPLLSCRIANYPICVEISLEAFAEEKAAAAVHKDDAECGQVTQEEEFGVDKRPAFPRQIDEPDAAVASVAEES
jgi:hypothetical protein